MYKFKTKSKTIIIFYHCFMKQKGSFTPEIETDIKKRIATPRKRVTCVCKWRNPLKAARPWEGFRNSWIQGHTQCHQYGGTFSLPLVLSQLCSPLCWLAFQAFFLEMAVALEAPGFYLQTQRKGSRTLIQFFFAWPPWTNQQQPIHMQCSDWPGLSHMPLSRGGLSLPKSQGIHVKEEWFPKGNPASGTRKGGKNACWECTKLINESLGK